MLTVKHTTEMGFDEGLTGTRMIRCAIEYVAQKPRNTPVKMVADVYSYVGGVFGVKHTAAERTMRTALRRAGYEGKLSTMILVTADRLRNDEFEEGE